MGKLISGLGLCLVFCSPGVGFGQDPFFVSDDEAPVLIRPSRTAQREPIIQNMPKERTSTGTNRPYTGGSKKKNTHVRASRTPAEEYIYQRALYRAEQRNKRIEERKWRNASLLRPDNRPEPFTGYMHILPTWDYDYRK